MRCRPQTIAPARASAATIEQGYDGGKTAFYSMVSSARPPRSTPVVLRVVR